MSVALSASYLVACAPAGECTTASCSDGGDAAASLAVEEASHEDRSGAGSDPTADDTSLDVPTKEESAEPSSLPDGGSEDGGGMPGADASSGTVSTIDSEDDEDGAGGAAPGNGGDAGTPWSGDAGAPTFAIDAKLASEESEGGIGTVAVVRWSLNIGALKAAHIDFGMDTDYGFRAPVDLAQAEHRALLLGLKPDTTYHFRIIADDGQSLHLSKDQEIHTDPFDDSFVAPAVTTDTDGRERGFIVTSYYNNQGSNMAFILDADGDIVWWHASSFSGLGLTGLARARMSADGNSMWMITANNRGSPLERVDMDGLGGQTFIHSDGSHDLTPVAGDVIAYIDYGEGQTLTAEGVQECESIFEMDSQGNIEEVFELGEYFDRTGASGTTLPCHGNALRYSATEDAYTISSLSEDIFVVYRGTDQVWRLAQNVEGGNQAWGFFQHGHHLLDDRLLIYANDAQGGTGTLGSGFASSVIEYSLSNGEELWRFDGAHYSENFGDVQRLPGGDTLITFSNDGVIQQVTPDGEVAYELLSGEGSYFGYAVWRDSLYGLAPDTTL